MSRSVRWVIAVGAVLAAFGLCLWLTRVVSWGWMPRGEADQWVVATAFATAAAGAVGAAMSWWAGREDAPAAPPLSGRGVRQRAKASGRSRVSQTGGSSNTPAGGTGTGPQWVDQDADVSDDAEVTQTGGDQNTSGPSA